MINLHEFSPQVKVGGAQLKEGGRLAPTTTITKVESKVQ
jgi:hypothetical protein